SSGTTAVSRLQVHFTEAMRDAGPTGEHSVTNPASYLLVTSGANGVFEGGAGDDEHFPIAFVTYDPVTFTALLDVDPAVSPLPDGSYQLILNGQDALHARRDQAGNNLGGGTDTTAGFVVDRTPPQVTLVDPAPGATTSAAVTQLRLRFSEAMRDAGATGSH